MFLKKLKKPRFVVWMEREFDAYKLSRCMCPFNYNRFWDTARYLWKNRHFIIPPCIRRPRYGGSRRNIGIRHPLWCRKTRMVSLHDGEKISKISLFVLAQLRNVTDRQTDGHRVTAIAALCIASCGKNMKLVQLVTYYIFTRFFKSVSVAMVRSVAGVLIYYWNF